MSESPEWPGSNFGIGQQDHLHALGVIIASYNLLEFSLFLFFMRYLNLKPESAQKIFLLIANPQRIEIIRDAVVANENEVEVQDLVLYFLDAYKILSESRNFLTHSRTILNNPDQDYLTFGKGTRRHPARWSYTHMNLEDLRKVADDIRSFWLFGSHIDAWIYARPTGGVLDFGALGSRVPELPEKPQFPQKLQSGPSGVVE